MNSLTNNKLPAFVITVLIIGLVLVIGIYVVSTIGNTTKVNSQSSFSNELLTSVTETGNVISQVSQPGFNSFVVTQVLLGANTARYTATSPLVISQGDDYGVSESNFQFRNNFVEYFNSLNISLWYIAPIEEPDYQLDDRIENNKLIFNGTASSQPAQASEWSSRYYVMNQTLIGNNYNEIVLNSLKNFTFSVWVNMTPTNIDEPIVGDTSGAAYVMMLRSADYSFFSACALTSNNTNYQTVMYNSSTLYDGVAEYGGLQSNIPTGIINYSYNADNGEASCSFNSSSATITDGRIGTAIYPVIFSVQGVVAYNADNDNSVIIESTNLTFTQSNYTNNPQNGQSIFCMVESGGCLAKSTFGAEQVYYDGGINYLNGISNVSICAFANLNTQTRDLVLINSENTGQCDGSYQGWTFSQDYEVVKIDYANKVWKANGVPNNYTNNNWTHFGTPSGEPTLNYTGHQSGFLIASDNYTYDQTGRVSFATGGDIEFNNTNWLVSGSYYSTQSSSTSNVSENIVDALSSGSSWITILVIVGFAVIVLGLLSEGLSRASRKQESNLTY